MNIPQLCVLHTIFKLDFEKLISMSTSLSKNLLSISECSLFEFTTCVVYMLCMYWTLHKWFNLWHCPVCMEILIHIVWIIDVYTHVKIFTLISQVSDSMMLLVHIFHIYCNICTRHICDIYVHICDRHICVHICNIWAAPRKKGP